MTSNNATASVCIDIDEIEHLLPRSSFSSPSAEHQIIPSQEEQREWSIYETGRKKGFENDCAYNLNHQYEHWKSNDWGKAPICIPDALEVNGKWFIRTLDPNAAGFGKTAVAKKEAKIKGDIAEQAVHNAFQRSTIGGILIHGLDFACLWKKLSKPSMGISEEIIRNLKPLAGEKSFEIDFLFFHPVCGIIIMECKAFDIEKRTGRTAYLNAIRQLERNVQKLFELFRILIGCDCPTEFVHQLLCIPNSRKDLLEKSEKVNILDRNDLEDNVAFEAVWKKRSAHIERQAGCFKNENICRFIAIIYGFRSALFTSFCRNALEIHRMVDSQESSKHLNRSLTFTTNDTDQFSINGKKTIFLNSEQISAYEKAKRVSCLLIFGPPGCGKTLLIMNLAKESAELNKPGRVVIILPYPELVEMYRKYFAANKGHQKRTIVINPTAKELQYSVAEESHDDVFADEVLYGGWINSKAKRKNGQIILGVTVGRYYDEANVVIARDSLVSRLRDADVCVLELQTVMRNTGNICEYYKRFNPDNQIIIGHNIRGRNVTEYDSKNIDSACLLIVDHIKQYLHTSDCTSNDIAVLIAHEPIFRQIEKVKRLLQKVGIKVGSVVEQLQTNNITDESLVAVDCSANVLSCEWPIVFVIDATECPFSKSVVNPIVACSRAVSSLYVITTHECKYPYFKYFFKKLFASMLYARQRKVSDFHLHDIVCEINLNPLQRRLFQFLFMLSWIISFFVIPSQFFLLFYVIWNKLQSDPSTFTKDYIFLGILGSNIFLIAILCIISSRLYLLDDYQHLLRKILNVLSALSISAIIFTLVLLGEAIVWFFIFAFANFLYLVIHLFSNVLSILARDWTQRYIETSSSLLSLLIIFLQLHNVIFTIFFIILACVLITIIALDILYLAAFVVFMPYTAPLAYWFFKLPLRPKYLKCITIDPTA